MILPRRLRVAPLFVILLLAGPLAAATFEHRPREVPQSRLSFSGLFYKAWVLMSQIFEKEGGSIDPFGKAGSGVDPFGKSGSSIDPFGNPTPNTQPPSGSTSAAGQSASGS